MLITTVQLLPKCAEIAADAAGEALHHERCVTVLIERITSGVHGVPAKVFNAARRANFTRASLTLPVHRRMGTH